MRIKKVASTLYKLIQSTQDDSDSPKELPLTHAKESLTGQAEAFLSSTDSENADFSINDLFPAVPAELKTQWD